MVGLVPGRPVAQRGALLLGGLQDVADELRVGGQRVGARHPVGRADPAALAARRRPRGPLGRARDHDEALPAALGLAGGERPQLVAHAAVAGARLLVAQAAAVDGAEVGGGVGARLDRGPVDDEPEQRRVHARPSASRQRANGCGTSGLGETKFGFCSVIPTATCLPRVSSDFQSGSGVGSAAGSSVARGGRRRRGRRLGPRRGGLVLLPARGKGQRECAGPDGEGSEADGPAAA